MTIAPLRVLGGSVNRLKDRWARVRRHRRLNVAVLGCLFVMFGLVVALVLAVRAIDADTTDTLGQSTELAHLARDLNETSELLRRYQPGSEGLADRLAALRDEITAHAADLELDDPARRVELDHLVEQVARVIDDGAITSAITPVGELSRRLERLAGEVAVDSELAAGEAMDDLDQWFRRIQVVAVLAAIVFTITVATVIIPLSRSIERSLNKLQTWRERSTRETARRTLAAEVADGLDVSQTEELAFEVVSRALGRAVPELQAELLLADSSNAHLQVVAAHAVNGGPGCTVVSPWSCPAVRRGATMVFDDSASIRSCPRLAERSTPCSAVCSPLTFMGQPMGVLHTTGPVGAPPSRDEVEDLAMIAGEAATRVGTLRAFAKAELQASTDVVTGLPNRRATEERLRSLVGEIEGGAIALIEVDGLLALSDRHGKAAGDRAMKAAAESLQFSCRQGDFVGRWSGSEFVVVLGGLSANDTRVVMRRLHRDLVSSFDRAELRELAVQIGIADTRLANTTRGILQVANDALAEDRTAGVWAGPAPTECVLPQRVRVDDTA